MTSHISQLERLRFILQNVITPKQFETVLSAILTETVQIDIDVAKSGFQHGADSGTAGRQGRKLRFEMKRYGDATDLDERNLLGGFRQALQRDPWLEAWVLIATKSVPEQISDAFKFESDQSGVPVLIFDWSGAEIPRLAALCTLHPSALRRVGCNEAADIAESLNDVASSAADRIKRDLTTWCLGYESLRKHSLKSLNAIWHSSRTAKAKLAQDIAGGSYSTTIERPAISHKFDQWWAGRAVDDAPLIITGLQGMGKSWASMQWAVNNQNILPVTLTLPSSTFATLANIDLTVLKIFIAEKLYGLTDLLTPQIWLKRLDNLFNRPVEQGPSLLIIIDGINQEPGVNWNRLFEVMQSDEIAGLVRVIATTRQLHFTQRLGKLSGLIVTPVVVELDKYDDSPGGEFDQRLAAEGLTRNSLTNELIDLARTPRLFQLVIKLRSRLKNEENITIHRLLWEYGCDSQGLRSHMQFSQQDWLSWLSKVADGYRKGKKLYDTEKLAKMLHRHDLNSNDVSRRVSEIADTVFATLKEDGQVKLTDLLISHALGSALLNHLLDGDPDVNIIENRLVNWLDPIAGLDEKPDILRAAVSILLERGEAEKSSLMSLLVTHWLWSQNLAEAHHEEIIAIAPQISDALLDVIELSHTEALESSRMLAVNALRNVPVTNQIVRSAVIARCTNWLLMISRDVNPRRRDDEGEKVRSAKLIERTGCDTDGPMTLLGYPINFCGNDERNLHDVIPSIINSGPLQQVLPILKVAALSQAINYRESYWNGLKWLCWFNEDDYEETARLLEKAATQFANMEPEAGVHPELKLRVAYLLLSLSGHPRLDKHPLAVNPPLDSPWNYKKHYLEDLSHGMFKLEMRHATIVMANTDISVEGRMRRLHHLMSDPAFPLLSEFSKEANQYFCSYVLSTSTGDKSYFREDHFWNEAFTAAACTAPAQLSKLAQQQFNSIQGRPTAHYPLALLRAQGNFLLLDSDSLLLARKLRNAIREPQDEQSTLIICALLIFETAELTAVEQYCRIIDADLPFISTDLAVALKTIAADDVDQLISYYDTTTEVRSDMLFNLLAYKIENISDTGWAWFIKKHKFASVINKRRLTKILYYADSAKLGHFLESTQWDWRNEEEFESAHFGSLALAQVLKSKSLQNYAHRIAPWTLFTAVSMYDAEPADYLLAASIVDKVLFTNATEPPNLDAEILISPQKRKRVPFLFSITPQHSQCTDPEEQFKYTMDREEGRKRHRQAVDTVVEKIRQFRASGATLYFCDFDARELIPALPHISEYIEKWISFADADSVGFTVRILSAEGFYLGLCEALIQTQHQSAISLWRKLGYSLRTRFLGKYYIEQFIHLAFINNDLLDAMAGELFELIHTNTDEALFEFSLAANLNGVEPWLKSVIEVEMCSELPWRRLRARYISGYLDLDTENNEAGWPEGPQLTPEENRTNIISKLRRDLRFAKHWWKIYTSSDYDSEAFAAWCMLLQCADKRTYVLIRDELMPNSPLAQQYPKRWIHIHINFRRLEEAISKKDNGLALRFLGRDIHQGIYPWC